MDTITHGIAGALIGKAVFRGEDMFASRPMNRARIVTWSLTLGAIFPDSDTLRDMFSSNDLLMITWHRSITHSLVCLPIFALMLAGLTRWLASWRKWDAPSFAALTGIYTIGILSHILLDLVTTFGTMIWSPVQWSRPAWDLIFIIDFTLTGIFLVPQLLAWICAKPEKMKRRALGIWLVFLPVPFVIAKIAQIVGAPISDVTALIAVLVFSGLFLLPARRGWGAHVQHATWSRVGLAAALIYIACAAYAHHSALTRAEKFAAFEHLEVESLGALPLPPSLWHWDGLIRVPHGVYELRMDLSEKSAPMDISARDVHNDPPIKYSFYPDAFPNSYIDAAGRLPEVQKVLWFSRFPVTRFHKEGTEAVVEISDLRFPKVRPDRASSFTYRVRMDGDGNVLSQGWAKR
jgi:membrane-bound metal-dependent hydrolase YbcI (DUF457 family)